MISKFFSAASLLERYYKPYAKWEYIEDPTYSRSIDSHVCMTCSNFDYSNQANCASILCCKLHQKLICHGQHLTYSCELYEKKASFNINKKIKNKYQLI